MTISLTNIAIFREQVDEAIARGDFPVIVDFGFADVPYVSRVVDAIVEAQIKLSKVGQTLQLTHVSEEFSSVLSACSTDKIVNVNAKV